ncbi:MAG: NAD(P)H-dependent oxidoreductase, partial [Salinisphaeraceae bacterium]|nr:NAD(P)H-dependent oxidoreductase [Salinisphaeraceae bacterium]
MSHLLQINSSLFADEGQSSHLTREFVAQWLASHPETQVKQRDFAREPVPHLTAERFRAFTLAAEERSPEEQAAVDYSDQLIEEIQQADVIVLGLPMYNFGVPSQLKAWFDHIARAGVTFRYTENGPQGLLAGKKLYVLAARGGQYLGTPMDTQTQYVETFFKFLG